MYQTILKIEEELKKELTFSRFRHTQGVMYTSAALAMRYSFDVRKAMLAGLLHDCAKCIPKEEMFRMCKKYHIFLTPHESQNPSLVHAKLGAVLARKKYGVEEEEILNAISWHTTGRANMSLLEEIVFVADYIEPNRKRFEGMNLAREAAFRDIHEAVRYISKQTLLHLKQKDISIDKKTEETYRFYNGLFTGKTQDKMENKDKTTGKFTNKRD